MLFLCYPRCSTCQNVKKWMEKQKIEFTERHIAEENSSFDELHKCSIISMYMGCQTSKPLKSGPE